MEESLDRIASFILAAGMSKRMGSENKLLKKYNNNIKLIAGDTNSILKEIDLKDIDFVFLDGGHSYQTVYNDLINLYKHMKDKKKVRIN